MNLVQKLWFSVPLRSCLRPPAKQDYIFQVLWAALTSRNQCMHCMWHALEWLQPMLAHTIVSPGSVAVWVSTHVLTQPHTDWGWQCQRGVWCFPCRQEVTLPVHTGRWKHTVRLRRVTVVIMVLMNSSLSIEIIANTCNKHIVQIVCVPVEYNSGSPRNSGLIPGLLCGNIPRENRGRAGMS